MNVTVHKVDGDGDSPGLRIEYPFGPEGIVSATMKVIVPAAGGSPYTGVRILTGARSLPHDERDRVTTLTPDSDISFYQMRSYLAAVATALLPAAEYAHEVQCWMDEKPEQRERQLTDALRGRFLPRGGRAAVGG